ncbi:hypothetical protein [Kocuria tytonis]|uniref:Uncharacterized protein n=1 Tax=Kocuria tytonis TaxID=2054280 RepID=A0A495A529_9MICC|nr:hypothetical protein [Kocuria tytonis]RKQ34873.1 hypothetical protein C1C97_006170 [Kocuria tytonis]
MSPSSARDPFGDGNAPWTGSSPARAASESEDTRPLPRPETAGRDVASADTAAMPSVPADDAARSLPPRSSPQTGRTGVASGRLHPRDRRAEPADPVGDDHLTSPQDRITGEAAWDSMRPAVRPEAAGATSRPTVESLRARQRQRFGGPQLLPGLTGLLVAMALGGLLLGAAGLVGDQFGVDTTRSAGDSLARAWSRPDDARLWSGVGVLGAVEFLSLLAGGYAAGRAARFSGVAQGVGVWLWSLLARAVASAGVALWAGAQGWGGSRWVVQEFLGGNQGIGAVALAGALVLGLLGAVLGGAWGMRYHRKVDAWTISNAMNQ